MTTEQAQRDHDDTAHERLAAIRRTLFGSGLVDTCLQGEEADKVAYLVKQYQIVRDRLAQIEREAASEEAEHLARVKAGAQLRELLQEMMKP